MGLEGGPLVERQRHPPLGDDGTVLNQDGTGGENLAEGVGEQNVSNPPHVRAPVELPSDVEEGVELIDLERELAVELPQLLVDSAVVDRGGGGDAERLGELHFLFPVRLGAVAQEEDSNETVGLRERSDDRGVGTLPELALPLRRHPVRHGKRQPGPLAIGPSPARCRHHPVVGPEEDPGPARAHLSQRDEEHKVQDRRRDRATG